jgi:voltage-gated potassium channel
MAPPRTMGSRLEKSIGRAVARRRIFPYLAGVTIGLALLAGFIMTLVDSKDFPTYGVAVWWAIVTLATVGYGDFVPTTPMGRVVGSAVIVFGVTFLAFLTATVTSYFVSSDQERAKAAELEQRQAADRELRELVARLEAKLASIEEKLDRALS